MLLTAVQQCQEPLAYILPPLALTQAKKRKKVEKKQSKTKTRFLLPQLQNQFVLFFPRRDWFPSFSLDTMLSLPNFAQQITHLG